MPAIVARSVIASRNSDPEVKIWQIQPWRCSLRCIYTARNGTVTLIWRDCLCASGTAAVAVFHFHLCSTVYRAAHSSPPFSTPHTGAICCHSAHFQHPRQLLQSPRETATTTLMSIGTRRLSSSRLQWRSEWWSKTDATSNIRPTFVSTSCDSVPQAYVIR